MTISRELMLAILSMDSYNRGYGVGLNFRQPSSQISGASTITFPDSVSAGWQAAGFYALAYDMTGVADFAAGERVIAYRGSDEGRLQDVVYGYPTAFGSPLSGQGNLAIDFARAVAGTNAAPADIANITVTGHSLGAGLAGYISALYNWQGVLFDPMPYTAAATNTYLLAVAGLAAGNAAEAERIYGESQASELTGIAANDVSAIDHTPRGASHAEGTSGRAGNPLLAIGDYTQNNGFGAEAIAVAFRTDPSNTRFQLPAGFQYDAQVFELPNLHGYGAVPDLWIANDNETKLCAA